MAAYAKLINGQLRLPIMRQLAQKTPCPKFGKARSYVNTKVDYRRRRIRLRPFLRTVQRDQIVLFKLEIHRRPDQETIA